MVTCKEAKQLRSGINVQGRIVKKEEIRNANTKYGETKVCDAYLVDDSGLIQLTLWGEDTEKVKVGDKVSIENGYTTTFRNEVQLNVPKKKGKLEILDKSVPPLDESPPSDKPPKKGYDEEAKADVESPFASNFPNATKMEKGNYQALVKMIKDKMHVNMAIDKTDNKNTKILPDKKAVENAKSDLRGMDLRGMDLTNAKLSDAKLAGADLRRADLRRADLRRADLYNAVLCGAKLTNADLDYADLSYADLSDVNLLRVDLAKAKRMGTVGLDMKKTGSIWKGHSKIGKSGSRGW